MNDTHIIKGLSEWSLEGAWYQAYKALAALRKDGIVLSVVATSVGINDADEQAVWEVTLFCEKDEYKELG